MQLPPFKGEPPQLLATGEHNWDLLWDRYPEIEFTRALWSNSDEYNQVLVIRNVDEISQKKIVEGISTISGRDKIYWINVTNSNDIWQAILSSYIQRYKILPPSFGSIFVKHSRYTWNTARTIAGAVSTLAKTSTEMFTQNNKVTLGEVLTAAELSMDVAKDTLSTPIKDIKNDGDSGFQSAFLNDFQHDERFRLYVQGSNFVMRGTFAAVEAALKPISVPGLRFAYLQASKLYPEGAQISAGGIVTLSASVLPVDKAIGLIEPVWVQGKADSKSRAFVNLVLQEHSRSISAQPSSQLLLGELALKGLVENIREALEKSHDPESVAPKLSPVDADVVNERLILRTDQTLATAVPLEALNEMRGHYLADARRLSSQLKGSNAAGPFLARMETTQQSLETPLTYSSSLVLGEQARALEVMLSSVTEVLVGVSASDIAAFVTGLGLFVRQFPAWREFVSEARDREAISPADVDALKGVAKALYEAPEHLVEPSLSKAVAVTEQAREELQDPLLDFGFVRTIGNVLRAIGRWIFDRTRGTASKINENIEKEVADFLTKTVLGTLILLIGDQLLHLASSLPLEFGWLFGLGILARLSR